MLYLQPPENFKPTIEVVCCWIEHNGEVLFLRRAPHTSQALRQNLPGGKVNPGETLEQALKREIAEECGFTIDNINFAKTVFIRRDIDFTMHMFKSQIASKPTIILDLRENIEYKWLTLPQIEELDRNGELITDGMACVKLLICN